MSNWNDDDNGSNDMDLGFDTATVDAPSYDLLPPGRYRVVCTSAKVAPSKNNPSTVMASIEETICDDESPHRGRKIWSRYVVAHADGKVMARGRADVVRMLAAYGVSGSSLAPMLERECVAAVDVEPAKGEWEARNKIKRREAIAGQAPSAPAPATKPAAARPAAAAPAFLAKRKPQGE